jgi:hypothetical protein
VVYFLSFIFSSYLPFSFFLHFSCLFFVYNFNYLCILVVLLLFISNLISVCLLVSDHVNLKPSYMNLSLSSHPEERCVHFIPVSVFPTYSTDSTCLVLYLIVLRVSVAVEVQLLKFPLIKFLFFFVMSFSGDI